MKAVFQFIVAILFLSTVSCATSLRSGIDDAKFALDNGDYAAAITAATSAVAADASNVEAGRVLASAYLGRGGFDILDLLTGVTDLQDGTDSNLKQIADILPTSGDITDLRNAIEALEAITGIDAATISDEELASAAFDLGLLMAIEHFAIGVYNSNYKTTLDVTLLEDSDRQTVQADLLSFDDRLIAAGIDSTEAYIEEVRKSFCVLESISSGEGFTLTEYQALVACELSDSPSTVNTAAIDSNIANCNAVNPDSSSQPTSVTNCYSEDTSTD